MPPAPRRPRRQRPRLPPRRPRRRGRRRPRNLAALAAVLAAVATVAFLVLTRGDHRPAPGAPATADSARSPSATTAAAPRAARRAETKPQRQERPAARVPTPPTATAPRAAPPRPRAALLIDDLGQNPAHLRALAALDFPLSVAILPGLPFTESTAREAKRRGMEILLHLPMEARETEHDPGPGALFTTMAPAEIAARVREDLEAVPDAVGVNNHMGSRFTEDPAAMAVLMAQLRGRGLFWLDSRTTAATVADEAAAAAGVASLDRDIFIDAEVDPAFIRGQLRKLVATALRRGSAIAIGHPHRETLAALEELRDELKASGVSWVPVSRLLAAPATAARPLARARTPEPGPR